MSAIASIKTLLGAGAYLDTATDMEPYLTGWRGGYKGSAALVAFPKNTEQVSAIVKLCATENISITPQGGNTGLVGGSVPEAGAEGIVLSLTRMNRVRSLDTENFTITAEAGVILEQLQDAADKGGFLFPLSMASEGSADVGGFVSTNAGGTAVLRYGTTRELVLGLEVVLPNGEVLSGLKALRKDNTGYDIKQLFIGAEGTLGIITAATFKLFPKPAQTETLLVATESVEKTVALFTEIRKESGDCLSAFEIISRAAMEVVLKHIPDTRDPFSAPSPYYVLMEFTTSSTLLRLREMVEVLLEEKLQHHKITDALLAESIAQAQQFWHMREHISEAEKKQGRGVHFDISVPISEIAVFIKTVDAEIMNAVSDAMILPFGHIGDGNIHYNICLPKTLSAGDYKTKKAAMKEIVYSALKRLDGSMSAEHGVGVERREDLSLFKSEVEMDLLKALKTTLDPHHIMNPGKMLRL